MTVELVVCGCSGTLPGAGRACSGFLVRSASTRVLLDCGNGSTANLQRTTALDQLDAIVLSHRHPDHCADLIGVYYGLRFHPDGERQVDVYAPAGTADFVAAWVPDSADHLRRVCRFHDVAPGDRVAVGDVALTFGDSPHVVPTVAVRVEHDGRVLAYSGDSAGGPDVVETARDADLFVCEATWVGDPADHPPGVHLTASGAAALAAEAGAARLALTHLYPMVDRERSRREAEARFDGPVTVLDDGDVLPVGQERTA